MNSMMRWLLSAVAICCFVSTGTPAGWLEEAESLLNPNGLTVVVPEFHFGTADDIEPDVLVAVDPMVIEAFPHAVEEDPSLETSSDPDVMRLRNLRNAWAEALEDVDYRRVLTDVVERVNQYAHVQSIGAEVALTFAIDNNMNGYRDVLAVSEAGFNATMVATFAQNLDTPPAGCWDCRYYDACWFGTCCRRSGSGCCVEITCPPEIIPILSDGVGVFGSLY